MDTTLPNKQYWGPIISTHPQPYRELIKRSLRLYFASFGQILFHAFLFAFIIFLPRLLAYIFNLRLISNQSFSLLDVIYIALIDFAALLVLVAMFRKLHDIAHYKKPDFRLRLDVNLKKVTATFVACVIQNIIVFGVIYLTFAFQYMLYRNHMLFASPNSFSINVVLMVLLFALQVAIIFYLSTLFIFLVPLIAIEDKHIFESIARTIALTWNHWWRVFATQLTPWICFFLLTLAVRYIADINVRIYAIDSASNSLLVTLLQMFLFTLFISWPLSLLYIQLKDLECRKKHEVT